MTTSSARGRALLNRGLRTQISGIVATGLILQVLNILSGPMVARMLGPVGRGEVSLVIVFATIGAQLGTASLTIALSHAVASHEGSARDLLRRWLPIWMLWCAVPSASASLAAYIVIDGLGHAPVLALQAGIITLGACWLNLFTGMLRGELAMEKVNRVRVVQTLLYVGLITLLFVAAPTEATWVVLSAFALALGVAVLCAWLSLRKRTGSGPTVAAREVHLFARRSFVSTVGTLDALGLDFLCIGLVLTKGDLGHYVVAGSVSTLPAMVLTGIADALLPRMAAVRRAASTALMRRWVLAAILIDLAIGIGLQIIIDPAIRILFGEEFVPSIACARVLIVVWMLVALRRVLAAVVQAQGKAGRTSVLELVAGALVVVTVTVGARIDGITGAAWGFFAVALLSCTVLAASINWRVPVDDLVDDPADDPAGTSRG